MVTLQGAGATFPEPLYKRWFREYYEIDPHVRVSYQGLGSGAGIRQFTAGLVHFGASDSAMSDKEIKQVPEWGVRLLPMTSGCVVLAYNLPGVKPRIKLPRDVYPQIFLGQDHQLERPGHRPSEPGREAAGPADHRRPPFRRQRHDLRLDQSPQRDQPRVEEGARRRQVGAVAHRHRVQGESRGRLHDRPDARRDRLPRIQLHLTSETDDGRAREPGGEVRRAVDSSAPRPLLARGDAGEPGRLGPRSEGAESYPIVSFTWILCRKVYEDPKVGETLKKVLLYGVGEGQKCSSELGYVPLARGDRAAGPYGDRGDRGPGTAAR